MPWFVLETTGSAAQTGLAAFFTWLSVAVAAFFGGPLVDRLGFRRMSVLADLAGGLGIAAIPLLYHTVGLAYWQLLLLLFLGRFLNTPGITARSALLPDLAELGGMRIERATAMAQAIERGSRVLGAPLAGMLIAFLGASKVLWIDAASFAICAVVFAVVIPPSPLRARPGEGYRMRSELLEGLAFIRRDRLILAIVLTVMVMNFVDAAFGGVLLPVYAKEVFGSAVDLGLVLMALAGGSVAGVLLYSAVGYRLSRRGVFTGGIILLGAGYWALALMPPLIVFAAIALVVGVAAGPLNPIIGAIEYERTPAVLRGRVFGAITAGAYLIMPLGTLLAGYSLEWLGIRPTLLAMGLCYLAVIGSLFLNPAFREMEPPRPGTAMPS